MTQKVSHFRGLLGIAIDPGWPTRPYVYFYAAHVDSTADVTMYTASGDLVNPASTSLTLTNPYVLLADISNTGDHMGGTLRFGPDGNLYVSLGDNGERCLVQDLSAYNGKILRLDISGMPGPGSGPPPTADITPADNPFTGPGPIEPLVYASGFRNPFRFAIDSETNDLYVGDAGEQTWEEMDAIERQGYSGANFGWPTFEGPTETFCCPLCTYNPPFTEPIYSFANAEGPSTVVGGPLYRGASGSPSSFPAEYEGRLFVHDFYGGWLRQLARGQDVWAPAPQVPGQPDPVDWATSIPFIADMQVGPDGALYLLTLLNNPSGLPRGLHRIVSTGSTSVGDRSAPRLAVLGPNPILAGTGTWVQYTLSQPAAVRLTVNDVAGRVVRVLWSAPASSGTIQWDGRTNSGALAAAGVYLVHLETANGPELREKLTVLR